MSYYLIDKEIQEIEGVEQPTNELYLKVHGYAPSQHERLQMTDTADGKAFIHEVILERPQFSPVFEFIKQMDYVGEEEINFITFDD